MAASFAIEDAALDVVGLTIATDLQPGGVVRDPTAKRAALPEVILVRATDCGRAEIGRAHV